MLHPRVQAWLSHDPLSLVSAVRAASNWFLGVSMIFLPRFFLSLLLLTGVTSIWAQTEPYRLRHGDAVRVSVWRDEALSMEVRVLPDGSITFPLAGRIEVVGSSTPEVEARIAAKLKPYIPEPVVTVTIMGIEGSRVYVLGKVVNPGPVVLQSPSTTVLQVLSQVGGLDRFADGNSIQVLRETPQGPRTLNVRYNDLLKGASLDSNVSLKPGDTVLVP